MIRWWKRNWKGDFSKGSELQLLWGKEEEWLNHSAYWSALVLGWFFGVISFILFGSMIAYDWSTHNHPGEKVFLGGIYGLMDVLIVISTALSAIEENEKLDKILSNKENK